MLDREVSEALAMVRSFRADPIPRSEEREQAYQRAVTESRRVAKRRKLTRLRWKWGWIDIVSRMNCVQRKT
jgi:hypothetical protein